MNKAIAQRGLSFWGWLYVLATLGVILMVGIKCVPIYMNNYQINSVLAWASQQSDLASAPAHEIQQRIQRRFDSGYVDNIKGRDVKVERTEQGRKLSVKYQVTEPLFGSMSMQFDFEETAYLGQDSG